jgi:hypothetical protein
VEANWKSVGLFNGGKAYFSNIVPGTLIWVRIRTYGLKNIAGDWRTRPRLWWCKDDSTVCGGTEFQEEAGPPVGKFPSMLSAIDGTLQPNPR